MVRWVFAVALAAGFGTFGLGVFLIVAGVETGSLTYVALGCLLVIVTLLLSTRAAFHISGGGFEIESGAGVVLPELVGRRSTRRSVTSRGPPRRTSDTRAPDTEATS